MTMVTKNSSSKLTNDYLDLDSVNTPFKELFQDLLVVLSKTSSPIRFNLIFLVFNHIGNFTIILYKRTV